MLNSPTATKSGWSRWSLVGEKPGTRFDMRRLSAFSLSRTDGCHDVPRCSDSREANFPPKIKKSFPETKFIVLSVYDESTVMKERLEAGAEVFMLKRCR
jgi:hypothetical protein